MNGLTTRSKVEALLREIGEGATSPGRIYLVGGSTAVLAGWRETTLDVDLKLDPEPGGVFGLIESIKRRLGINVELASPDQFVPALPGWESRSPFIARHGCVDFHHYDPYGQVLAKIERGHDRDWRDVRAMVDNGWVEPGRLLELFLEVKELVTRFPAVDAAALEVAVRGLAKGER